MPFFIRFYSTRVGEEAIGILAPCYDKLNTNLIYGFFFNKFNMYKFNSMATLIVC